MNLSLAQTELRPFLEANPFSLLEEYDTQTSGEFSKRISIVRPWGDPTVRILLPHDEDEASKFIEHLNHVILPPRFTAIWHRDTSMFEVIWTAQKLSPSQQELSDREFKFQQNGFSIQCRFGGSSERLIQIGKCGFPERVGAAGTNFRNLQSFNQFGNVPEEDRGKYGIDVPRSFFIEGIGGDYDEEKILELVRNINFFLRYYDALSPVMMIHPDLTEDQQSLVPVRYRDGSFPRKIQAADLDENLLSFWSAAGSGNEILRFMLYWRIIEYAAFHHMNVKTRSAIRKALSDPSLSANIEASTNRIIGLISNTDLEDVPRFNSLLQSAVSPLALWPEIEANRAAFSKDVVTDGGFCVPKVISENETLETFSSGGVVKVAHTLRKVRNCLSHGKDQGSDGVILPTTRNLRILRPWVFLIGRIAGEVVIYKDVP